MKPRERGLARWTLCLALALHAGALGAEETSARCEAAIDQAAGRYSACLLRADAHFKRKPNANQYENRQGRCEQRYERETRRALRRHGEEACASMERLSAIAVRTERYTENVAREAQDQDAIDLVYVQSGTGASLTDSTLTLSGVDVKTGWVTEQAQSDAGQTLTTEFLDFFNEVGPYSFFENPPRAELTCEVDASPESFSMVLREAAYDSELEEITYAIERADTGEEEVSTDPITCDGNASLFIDPEPCVPAGGGCSLSPPTNNQVTVALLNRMNWDKNAPDWVVPGPRHEEFGKEIYCPLKQINSFTVFGDWFYQCLKDDDDMKRYLNYFVASAYASEEFIWRTPGVMPVYYESALPLIRGSNEYLPEISTWTTDSDRGKEFPVLNSGAADTVIALVMEEFSEAQCSIGFGQWQQTHVSGSILSPPWALPVDTDQNPVVMQDIDPVIDVDLNVNRHKLVLGPITWLAMALDVENWKNTKDKSVFADQIALGKQKWEQIHENIDVNKAICKAIPKKEVEGCGPFPPAISKVVSDLMPDLCTPPTGCANLKPELWKAAIRVATAAFRLDMCDSKNHGWSHLELDGGKQALSTALDFLEDQSEPHGGPSTEAINNAAMVIQEFYFGPDQEDPLQPFTGPLVEPVYPPVTQLPTD